MNRTLGLLIALGTIIGICLCTVPAGSVGLDWEKRQELKLDKEPLDIASSVDGKWLFVLVPGEIRVYSLDGGAQIQRIPVDPETDRISHAQGNNCIIASNRTGKNVNIIELQEVHDIDISGLPFRGPKDAPVVVVTFADYQCPYCARLESLIGQVMSTYPKEVKYVNKNFPLSNHKFARKAAIAALAAARQNKFWEFHSKLYENMRALSDDKIREIATELGLDMEKWEKDKADPAIAKQISSDLQNAQSAGVRGTPTVFVNGKYLKQRSLEGFSDMIEAELQRDH